jgi:hypothetical protein
MMIISSSRNVMLLLMIMWLTLSMTGFNSVSAGLFQKSRVFITIKSDFVDGVDVTVRCKSDDDGIAARKLKRDEEYKFDFKPNFLGTTLFFCNFQWTGGDGKNNSQDFLIYKYTRDTKRCGDCRWKIDATSACIFNRKKNKYDTCYMW